MLVMSFLLSLSSLGSKVKVKARSQKMHPTTSSDRVLMGRLKPSWLTGGTTSHRSPGTEPWQQRRLRRSGAGQRAAVVTRQPLAITCGIILNVPLYRRNKVVNHFSIMLKRRLCEEDEEDEKPGKKKKKASGRVGNLRIHDLEEELEMSNDSDCSVGDGKYRWPLTPDLTLTSVSLTCQWTATVWQWILFLNTDGESKKKPPKNRVKGKGNKRKREENTEALEDSDDGDHEGLEVDYISEDSRSDQSFCRSSDFVFFVLFP